MARFTSQTFNAAVTMTEDGVPASTKATKAYVEGTLNVSAETDTIATVTETVGYDWTAPGSLPIRVSPDNRSKGISTDGNGTWYTFNYYSAGNMDVCRSTNNGQTWTSVVQNVVPNVAVRQMANNGSTLIITSSDTYARSTNGGASWTSHNFPNTQGNLIMQGISYRPGHNFFVYGESGFTRSTNSSGTSWQNEIKWGNNKRPNTVWMDNPNGIFLGNGASTTTHWLWIPSTNYTGTPFEGTVSHSHTSDVKCVCHGNNTFFVFLGNGTIWADDSGGTAPVHSGFHQITTNGDSYGSSAFGGAYKISDSEVLLGNKYLFNMVTYRITALTDQGSIAGQNVNGGGSFTTNRNGNAIYLIYGTNESQQQTRFALSRSDLTFTTDKDLTKFAVGDAVTSKPGGATGFVNSVTAGSKAMSIGGVTGTFAVGETVAGPPKQVANAKLYTVNDANGAVSDLTSSDPGFVDRAGASPYGLTFPATFPSGNEPDVDLPAGTTLTVEVEASNDVGSDTATSNTITPV